MNSPLSQSDLSNVMLWQTLSFTCQTVQEKKEKKHLVNHSGCISITEEKWNGELKYSDPASFPRKSRGWGDRQKFLHYSLRDTWAYHISYVSILIFTKEAPFSFICSVLSLCSWHTWVMKVRANRYNAKIQSVNNHDPWDTSDTEDQVHSECWGILLAFFILVSLNYNMNQSLVSPTLCNGIYTINRTYLSSKSFCLIVWVFLSSLSVLIHISPIIFFTAT